MVATLSIGCDYWSPSSTQCGFRAEVHVTAGALRMCIKRLQTGEGCYACTHEGRCGRHSVLFINLDGTVLVLDVVI